jgi:hypothetical protein
MSDSKKIIGISMLFILGCSGVVIGQDEEVPKTGKGYSYVAYLGAGVSYFTGSIGTPASLNNTVRRLSPCGTARIMWQPEYKLGIGFETGWTPFYSYHVNGGINSSGNAEPATMNLNTIPVLMVFSMPFGQHLRLFGGPGGYLLTSHLNYYGNVREFGFSFGYMAAVNYSIRLSDNVRLATEIKWMNARQTKDVNLSAQMMAIWKLKEW